MIVHVLHQGKSLCNMRGYPNEWPVEHKWVGLDEPELMTCPGCTEVRSGECPAWWVCHVCRQWRPNSLVSVIKHAMRWPGGLEGTENVCYCNDRKDCLEKAMRFSFFPKELRGR